MKYSENKGQAVLEYLIIFALMALIGVKFSAAISSIFGNSIGRLGEVLTEKLTTGICPTSCYYNGFKNIGGK